MAIACRENTCIYYRNGECDLTRAASAGARSRNGCVYFVARV